MYIYIYIGRTLKKARPRWTRRGLRGINKTNYIYIYIYMYVCMYVYIYIYMNNDDDDNNNIISHNKRGLAGLATMNYNVNASRLFGPRVCIYIYI